jgi:hypothetical protein
MEILALQKAKMTFYVRSFLEKSFSRHRQSVFFGRQKAQNEYPRSQKIILQGVGNTGIIDFPTLPKSQFGCVGGRK